MTLTTRVRIAEPLAPATLWEQCQSLIGATTATQWSEGESWRPDCRVWRNRDNQGLCALLWMTVGADGPIPDYDDEHDQPPAVLEVTFDTHYGYRDLEGGCEALHRRLTAQLGEWLDDRGVTWWAKDEYHGTWHRGEPCPRP